jgi:hypothetical protein
MEKTGKIIFFAWVGAAANSPVSTPQHQIINERWANFN